MTDEKKFRSIDEIERNGKPLREILNAHRKWVESGSKEGEQANLQRANLREANLREADLQGADLQRADLREANLRGANLQGANLKQADLQGANLIGANLEQADLQVANFIGANLEQADLRSANLQQADLRRTNLQQADLSGANLEQADLSGANLEQADLREANLEQAFVGKVSFNRKTRCRAIRTATCYGSQRFKRFAQDQDFLEELRETRKGWVIYWLWWLFADCGRSIFRWSAWSLFFALFFAAVFFHLETVHPDSFAFAYLPRDSFITVFYYSVVTFTTLGFGDVVPKTSTAALGVTVEVILGYVMLGGLISIFATLLARRSG